jgi:hypothetical protein
MRYYTEEASEKIVSEFWHELSSAFAGIKSHPTRFHFDRSGLRRLNLQKFPYHILFEELPDRTRIQVLRHHSRNPKFGIKRKWD